MKKHIKKSLFFSVACILFSIYGMQAQAQELLNYPLDTINGVEVYRYHVDKGIGIYRIGVNFNVSKEVLYRYNPELRNGVKYNQLIFIPTGRPVTEGKSQKVTAKAQQPAPAPQKVEQKSVVVEQEPVVVEPKPVVVEPKPVVVDPQPKSKPVVREQQIEANRTIVIGPQNKNGKGDQTISTLYLGPNKKDNRLGEIDVIRIGRN